MPAKNDWPADARWPGSKKKPNSSRRWRLRMTNIPAGIDPAIHRLTGLMALLALALSPHAGAATLNKCIDAKGEVTYSNLPCRNARETRTLEIDPAPEPDPGRMQAVPAPPKAHTTPHPETRTSSAKPVSLATKSKCDTLTDKLGHVVDKMDQAHRKGYTQKQMDTWNQEVRDLERKKQQSGCF